MRDPDALPRELGEALYRPVRDEAQLGELASRVAHARTLALAHAGGWLATSIFLAGTDLATTFFRPLPLAARAWAVFPILGWGIGVVVHAFYALVAAPRALEAQREALHVRGLLAEPDTRELASLVDDLTRSARFVKSHVRQLDPPRVDLEASLDVAEREADRLMQALLSLEEGLRSPATRRAERRRLEALSAERDRLRASLEELRVTLSNLEIDVLLEGSSPRTSAFAMESLAIEADLLRAAVEGAQAARAAVASTPASSRSAKP
ncbi:MAG: 2TM domain-containing protein [Acidobacteriota bacterium]